MELDELVAKRKVNNVKQNYPLWGAYTKTKMLALLAQVRKKQDAEDLHEDVDEETLEEAKKSQCSEDRHSREITDSWMLMSLFCG